MNDPEYICRSIGYFLSFLEIVVPVLGLLWIARRVAK